MGSGSFGNSCSLDKEFLIWIVKVLNDWGVKSIEFAGGGEPMMNSFMLDAVKRKDKDSLPIEMSMITNGNYKLYQEEVGLLAQNMRWIGFSIDAGNKEDFKKVHGISGFENTIANIEAISTAATKSRSLCDIGYKFLIHEHNVKGLYDAAKLAKEIGARHFHARPLHRTDAYDDLTVSIALELVGKAMSDFDDENFSVFGVQHKFTNTWNKSLPFKKCLASPLMAIIMADKTLCACCDRRDSKSLHIGKLESPKDIIKLWGSERHREVVKNINVKECPRCIFTYYNELMEKAFVNDDMCRNFV